MRAAVALMEESVPRARRRDGSLRPFSPEHRVDAAGLLDAELQERIGAPMRKLMWERASLSAVVAGIAVDASAAEAGLGIGIVAEGHPG